MKINQLIYNKGPKFLLSISFLACLVVNYLSNSLPLNGYTPGQLSDLYPNIFVPSGFTFGVWGLIYFFAIMAVFLLVFKANRNRITITYLFSFINILNISWLFAWHFRFVLLSLLIMVSLLVVLSVFYVEVRELEKQKINFSILKAFSSLYLSWICVATIANFTTLLIDRGLALNLGLQMVLCGMVLLVAFGVNVGLSLRHSDYVFPLVLAWAAYGIYYKQTRYNAHVEIAFFSSIIQYLCLILSAYIFWRFKLQPRLMRSN
jgi:hypothetical protein